MLEKLANIFRVPDLRKRVFFTLAMLAVYRLGSHIPTPGVDAARLHHDYAQARQEFRAALLEVVARPSPPVRSSVNTSPLLCGSIRTVKLLG